MKYAYCDLKPTYCESIESHCDLATNQLNRVPQQKVNIVICTKNKKKIGHTLYGLIREINASDDESYALVSSVDVLFSYSVHESIAKTIQVEIIDNYVKSLNFYHKIIKNTPNIELAIKMQIPSARTNLMSIKRACLKFVSLLISPKNHKTKITPTILPQ